LSGDEVEGESDNDGGSPGQSNPARRRLSRDPLSKKVPMPSHAIWLRWGFGEKDLHTLEFDITFHSDPGDMAGEYFAPFNGYICDQLTYGGIQTELQRPDGSSAGKGGLFSTWWTFDAADAEIAGPDGFAQLGTHEGNFLGVRRPFSWTAEHLRFTISRTRNDPDRGGHWFNCSVTQLERGGSQDGRPTVIGEPIRIGALRFEDDKGFPPTIGASPLSFLEVYSGARTFADIPDWHIDVMAYGNGVRSHSLTTEYPAFPKKEVPNTDAWYDPATDRAHLRFGRETVRQHPAARYF
jgi:hypothetical protein